MGSVVSGPMRFQIHMVCTLMTSFVVSGALAQSPATIVTSDEGIVLLRNGQTLKGDITRTGDYYLVTRGVTSEVRLPAASVELVCADLEALYQYKVLQLERGSRAGHLALARWCLQHALAARAADQTLMAFALDPDAAGIDIIERQLLAMERPADSATAVTPKARAAPTLHEVEQTIDALSPSMVQQFVTSVQPLLMNRCATNGCHGSRSKSEFRLLRPTTRQSLSRRMTQRYLVATLGYVDRGNPRQSKLVTMARTQHGGREAVFSETETHQVQMLARWIADLASQPIANLPASIAGPPAFLLQTRAEAVAESKNAFSTDDTSPAATPSKTSRGANLTEEYQPRDPFDPEIFNRRFQRNANSSR